MSIIQAMRDGKDHDSSFGIRFIGTGELACALSDRFNTTRDRLGMGTPGRTLNTSLFNAEAGSQQASLF